MLNSPAAVFVAACLLASAPAQAPTQPSSPTPPPAYDAVSIRPSTAADESTRWRTTDDGFTATNMRLSMLLVSAYNTRDDLISGLPGWAMTAHYDITAKVTDADPAAVTKLSPVQRDQMLVQVLADRFHLKIHPETRQLPVYDLTLAKGGSRLVPNATPPAKTFDPSKGGMPAGAYGWSDHDFNGTAVALSTLVGSLASMLERTIIDHTGLTGTFDIHLKWTPDRAAAGPDAGKPAEEAAPPIFTALEQQLGLKLIPAKGPVQTWVVDHIDRPAEN